MRSFHRLLLWLLHFLQLDLPFVILARRIMFPHTFSFFYTTITPKHRVLTINAVNASLFHCFHLSTSIAPFKRVQLTRTIRYRPYFRCRLFHLSYASLNVLYFLNPVSHSPLPSDSCILNPIYFTLPLNAFNLLRCVI